MSRKNKAEGKFNGKYMDYCAEFDPTKAGIAGSGEGGWDAFEVPLNESERVERRNLSSAELNRVLTRAKAMKIGRGILSLSGVS